jgi:hypothetical protein
LNTGSENFNRDHWQAKARRVARAVNFAWWLETLSAPLLIIAMIGAAGLWLVRREFSQIAPWILVALVGTSVLILALGCWARAARKFEKPEQSLVRIEAAMLLKNSLSAAQAGVSSWPAPLGKIDAGLTWQWPRLGLPLLGALLLLATGLLIPVAEPDTKAAATPEQPQAWLKLASELDHLTRQQVVDEKYLEETRKRLEELKSQEPQQWFSHSSLEASDSLKDSHRAETARVERELGRAEKTLESLGKNSEATNQAEQNRLMEEFDQALQGLQNGVMKPNPALLKQMNQLASKELKNLTSEQIEQLQENLRKTTEAIKQGGGGGESDELLASDGQSQDGNGRVDRGPGHSPGVLGEEKDALESGKLTGLEAQDLSQATPGDLLELQNGEHDVNKRPSQVTGGGNTDATGKGGDRVWKETLDPAEQRTLKRFFE